MTPRQTFLIAALGGISGALGLVLGLALSVALALFGLKVWERLQEVPEAWRNRQEQLRARRADFDACRAIAALPAHNPEEGQ
ncbi:hypothetical protein AB8A21_41165 [Streptomyces sp. BF23-18]|uniref:hypothetical protein n=1 Tax=Streptomyces sp. BF23-18 TaxID=3240282 RepID=UPI0034E3789F